MRQYGISDKEPTVGTRGKLVKTTRLRILYQCCNMDLTRAVKVLSYAVR